MTRYLVCTLLGWALALGAVGLAAVGDPPAKEPEPILKKKQKEDQPGPELPKPDPKSKKDSKDDEPILKKKPKKDDKPDPKEVDPKELTPLPPTEKPEEILKRVRENMEAAEKRLKEQDPGTATRKIQRDIVRDLDDLINQQNDDNSGGGGGSKQKKRQRSQANNQAKSGGKGDPKNGDPKTAQEPKSGTGDTGNGGKKSEAGKANSPSDFAEWGHLPAHKRMELDAYSRDRFMREYEMLLRQYYRTIAEQGRRKEQEQVMRTRLGLLMGGPLAAVACLGWLAEGKEERAPDGALAKGMITAETDKAIGTGLAYLAKQQANDGSWGTGQFEGNVAITSLAGLAFLAGGHQAGRGRYGKAVSRAVDYVLQQEDRNVSPGFLAGRRGNPHGPMYNHGFATLFLAEVHGMMPSRKAKDEVKEALERAVKLIVEAQNHEGGWRYNPVPDQAGDISVTICQIMALRAARNAGVSVPKEVVEKCIKYVKRCQDEGGGFRYQAHHGGSAGFARTAAGVVALHSAGVYDDKSVDKGLEYLMRFKPGGRQNLNDNEARIHYYYGHYYAAQAMWTKGGKAWKEWFPAIRDELLRRFPQGHRQDNHWFDGVFCPHYCTAMALIILQIPNNYLPILQR